MMSRSSMLFLCASLAFAAPISAQAPPAPAAQTTPMPARPAPLPQQTAGFVPSLETLDRLATPPFSETSGTLFDNVVAMLSARYVDQKFRTEELPKIVEKYRERARESVTLDEQRAVVHDLLSHIPASHLGLLSKATHRGMLAELLRYALPTFGFQLVAGEGGYYAVMVLENGPAIRNGLLQGDRIVTVDGVKVEDSPRFDWRSDDAYIGDERDPAIHQLIAAEGDRVELRVERRPGEFVNVSIAAEEYSAFDAARASARVIRTGGKSFGYVHFWYVHLSGVPDLLREKIDGEFAQADALIIDLRGRGGSATEVVRIVALVRDYMAKSGKPVVALVDRQSRSGKDILAYEFKESGVRLVGEASAGAVIPAMFGDVGHDSVLMFPTFRLPGYTDKLELQPSTRTSSSTAPARSRPAATRFSRRAFARRHRSSVDAAVLMLGAMSGIPRRRRGESSPAGAARSLRPLFNAVAKEHRTQPLRQHASAARMRGVCDVRLRRPGFLIIGYCLADRRAEQIPRVRASELSPACGLRRARP